MAEDDGTGRPVYGRPTPMPSKGGGGKDLDVDADELVKFKDRVDNLLVKLESSPAAPNRMNEGAVPAGDLGVGFSEATALHGIYQKVHAELQNLSKGLAGQIEGLSIAVQGSTKGYQNIEEDIKERMRTISKDAREAYDRREAERRASDPEQPKQPEQSGDAQPKQDGAGDTSGGAS
ncbi:hypothetical protein [Streptomyces albipurpureus]|uniref:Uncharacterized protein n=1 Tax=Streptomyces albipurpureus TaxID=2897419 RepID=A0ABT0UXB4_9ACTN|nr:hypothetical protein [Streptomyces sp. CWNU-1]MCM2392275.1 hypothetical protein [Streptomyces sp. CWNU-1]